MDRKFQKRRYALIMLQFSSWQDPVIILYRIHLFVDLMSRCNQIKQSRFISDNSLHLIISDGS